MVGFKEQGIDSYKDVTKLIKSIIKNKELDAMLHHESIKWWDSNCQSLGIRRRTA